MHISYLEIYNDTGYDLLDPNRDIKMLEDLPKVRAHAWAAGRVARRGDGALAGHERLLRECWGPGGACVAVGQLCSM